MDYRGVGRGWRLFVKPSYGGRRAREPVTSGWRTEGVSRCEARLLSLTWTLYNMGLAGSAPRGGYRWRIRARDIGFSCVKFRLGG